MSMQRVALPFLLLLFVAGCFAQGVTGTITGVVKDPTGAVIPGAAVTAHNVGTGADSRATTDDTGSYRIANLAPGEYTIIVEAPGFKKTTVAPQRLSVSDVLRHDISLEVGVVSEQVNVEE